MNPADLAQMLELMASALRAMRSAPVVPVAGMAPPAPSVPQRTMSDWLDIHENQILGKGYKVQTIRNRRANLSHVRRLWGASQIDAIRAHEIISRLRAEFLSARMYRAQGVDVQTLLGHKHAEMTAIYEDDRGLSAKTWKTLAPAPAN